MPTRPVVKPIEALDAHSASREAQIEALDDKIHIITKVETNYCMAVICR